MKPLVWHTFKTFLLLCLNVVEKSIVGCVMAGSIVTNHSI